MSTPIALDSLEDAIADIAAGKPVIVVDSEDRENEGDLIFAAQLATPETVAFMIRYSSGYICVSMSDEHAYKLELQPMVARNQDERKTAYTVTVDASHDITTGISAHDRSRTISLLGNPTSTRTDFIRPGHIVPLRARPWGVLERAGHTEAAVDLAKVAGLEPVGALCEIVSQIDPTKMARLPELRTFADEHDLKLITIEQLIEYRTRSEQTIERVAQANLPTEYGNFTAVAYRELVSGQEHIALVKGSLDELSGNHVLTRVHSECLTGEAFGSHKCDCGPQLHAALNAINQQGRGVVVYLKGQEGRGIGLAEKIKAYSLQDQGMDTVEANEALGLPADSRNYDAACAILRDLGVTSVELITNNPAKIEDLERHGIVVHDRQESKTVPFTESEDYLRTKQSKMGHRIDWI